VSRASSPSSSPARRRCAIGSRVDPRGCEAGRTGLFFEQG
jgi:hypothetical protein